MLKTGPRTFATVVVTVLGLWLFGWLFGFFGLLIALIVVGGVTIGAISWKAGGSSQKEHDTSMNRLPGIDKPAREWASDLDEYEFPPLPDMPEDFKINVAENQPEDTPTETPQ
ncbi:MAG: hypothetical protein H6797_01055 [Candidatus Nomurabacteria bacterium]|nr:MAG: hypothetical protein H6797_01055 [Candidatus Nomurabacteria bacterium]